MLDDSAAASSTQGAPPPRTTGGHVRWEPPTAAELQAMMPGYTIEKILGRGGMGAVYQAVQVSLDRPVAIKVLPGDLLEDVDAQFAERFKNEARTMAKMNHPGIVNVYDFGVTQTGLLYIVMEFVDGTDVAKMITSQGRLPPDYALAISAHVSDALHYAHKNGIIHRDIKPANILINMEGVVKVADFGLAKQNTPGESGLTKTNMAMGTPDFVAPEALIPGMPLDGRADLYAMGVMLYQMLTGEIPRGMWSMPGAKLGTDPRFDAIIGKAMQTDREMRYQSAAEIRQDLDTLLTTPRAVVQKPATTPAAQTTPKPGAQGQQAPQQKPAAAKSAPPPPAEQPAAKKTGAGLWLGIGAALVVVAGVFLAVKKPAASGAASGAAGGTAVDAAFMREVAGAATPQRQVDLVVDKIKAINGHRVKATPGLNKGKVTALTLTQDGDGDVPDISPVAALQDLTLLNVYYLSIQDISCLRGLKLENLTIHRGRFQDISALRGMPLKQFALRDAPDLDYSILSGMAITQLDLGMTGLTSIAFVKGMPLTYLDISRTKVRDLSPLRGLPLKELKCDFVASRDTEILRSIKTLTRINDKPLKVFWAEVDAQGAKPASAPVLGVLPVKQTLDLLALTDPVRDRIPVPGMIVRNEWVREDSSLVFKPDGKSGKLAAPVAFTCRDYEIELRAERLSGSDRLHFDVPLNNGRIVPLVLNAPGRKVINDKDGKPWGAAAPILHVTIRVVLSKDRASDRLVIQRKDTGETMADWSGSLDNLGKTGEDHPGFPKQPLASIFLMKDPYAIKLWTLRVFEGEAKVLRGAGAGAVIAAAPKKEEAAVPTAAAVMPPAVPVEAIKPTTSTAPSAAPVMPASPPDSDPRLAQLEAGFKARYEADAQKPFLAALAALNQSYVEKGIGRARAAAQKKGDLAEVTALDAEKARMQSQQPLPPADLETLPESLKALRSTYRAAYAKIETERVQRAAPLYDLYLGALDAYIAELTKGNKIDKAQKVQALRDEVVEQKPKTDAGMASVQTGTKPPSSKTAVPVDGKDAALGRSRWYEAARWVVAVGGNIRVDKDGRVFDVKSEAEIPAGRFDILSVTINGDGNAKVAGITDDDFARFSGLKELNYIRLRSVKVGDNAFTFLPTTPNVTRLELSNVPVTDVLLTHMAPLRQLTSLMIQATRQFTGSGLEKLASLSLLKNAWLDGTGFNDAGMKALAGAKNLETLDLTGAAVTDAGVAGFEAFTKLSELSLSDCKQVQGAALASWGGMAALKQLNLHGCPLSTEAFTSIARLKQLTDLNLDYARNLNDETLPALAPLTRLVRFSAWESRVTGTGFAAWKGGTELRDLHLQHGTPVSGAGLAAIAATFPKLEVLVLGEGARVQAEDFRPLAALKSLKLLDVAFPRLDDAALAEISRISSLERLNANSTAITATGIGALKPLKLLATLLVENCKKLDDSAIPALKELKGLRSLFTKENAITADGIATLKKAMPQCNVIR